MSSPESLTELVALMCHYGNYPVEHDELWPSKLKSPEVTSFMKAHFPTGRQFFVAELIRFVEYDHEVWPEVVAATVRYFKRCGCIDPDYSCGELLITSPEDWLPK